MDPPGRSANKLTRVSATIRWQPRRSHLAAARWRRETRSSVRPIVLKLTRTRASPQRKVAKDSSKEMEIRTLPGCLASLGRHSQPSRTTNAKMAVAAPNSRLSFFSFSPAAAASLLH